VRLAPALASSEGSQSQRRTTLRIVDGDSESTSLPVVDDWAEGPIPCPVSVFESTPSLCSHRLTDRPTKLTSPGFWACTGSATSDHHLEEWGYSVVS
jgi:hypothetical protein